MSQKPRRIDPLELVDFEDDALFYGSVPTLEELASVTDAAVDTIRESDSPRLVVIETWLVLDYAVREFLVSGLDLNRLNVSSFDLRYRLLPRSLGGILNTLEGFISAHRQLPRPPEDNSLTMSMRFLIFLKKEHPADFDRLLELERAYYRRYFPELAKQDDIASATARLLRDDETEYTRLSEPWLEVAERLDNEWFRNARRLNEARNFAAHVHDHTKILQVFGYAGPSAFDRLKEECERLLRALVGVAKRQDAP